MKLPHRDPTIIRDEDILLLAVALIIVLMNVWR